MSEPTLGDRGAQILRALVSYYVTSGEPVGSKTLVERYRLGVGASLPPLLLAYAHVASRWVSG